MSSPPVHLLKQFEAKTGWNMLCMLSTMNPLLEKLNFNQLLELFMRTSREFIAALESNRSFKELKALREQVKKISEAIKIKKQILAPTS